MKAYFSQNKYKSEKMTEIVSFLHSFDEMPFILDTINEFGQISESLTGTIPIITSDGNFVPGFIIYAKLESKDFNKTHMINDKQLKNSLHFLFINENKIKLNSKTVFEVAINQTVFKDYRRLDPHCQNFMQFYEKETEKEAFLFKILRILHFLVQVKYDVRVVQKYVEYWLGKQETEPEIFFRVGKEIDRLADEELSPISNLLIMKEKLMLWMMNTSKFPTEKFEIFISMYVRLLNGFHIINAESFLYKTLVRICLLNYVRSKNPQMERIHGKLIHERIAFLNELFKIDILNGYELSTKILAQRNFDFPENLEKFDKILLSALNENVAEFVNGTDILVEQFLADQILKRRAKSELDTRLIQIQFWLSFNQNLRFQNKILNGFKSLKEKGFKFQTIEEKVQAMEIQFYLQMRYFKNVTSLLNFVVAEKDSNAVLILSNLRKMIPDSCLKTERIDPSIVNFKDFKLKTFFFARNGFFLVLKLFFDFKHKNSVSIRDLQLKFKTDDENLKFIHTQSIETITFENDLNSVDVMIAYDRTRSQNVNYLIINELTFKLENFSYSVDPNDFKNKNINFDEIPIFQVNSSGFVNKLTAKRIFFEKNSPNYFFIEFSVFDNKSTNLNTLKIDFFKSSKYIILDSSAVLFKENIQNSVFLNDNVIVFSDLTNGRYILVLKIYLLYSKIKNYQLKLKTAYKNRNCESIVSLKSDDEAYYYLESEILFKNDKFSQLRLWNNTNKNICLYEVDHLCFRNGKFLKPGEEFSLILQEKEEAEIEYELIDSEFESQTIHQELASLGNSIIRTSPRIRSTISIVERFVFNKDMTIKNFEIKNRKEVQIYEQNQFILSFKFNKQNMVDSKQFFIELTWDSEKYCIIGKTKFFLVPSNKIKTKEITFVPYDSGFLDYPKILLVELGADLTEIRYLINRPSSNKRFFVKEGFCRVADVVNY